MPTFALKRFLTTRDALCMRRITHGYNNHREGLAVGASKSVVGAMIRKFSRVLL